MVTRWVWCERIVAASHIGSCRRKSGRTVVTRSVWCAKTVVIAHIVGDSDRRLVGTANALDQFLGGHSSQQTADDPVWRPGGDSDQCTGGDSYRRVASESDPRAVSDSDQPMMGNSDMHHSDQRAVGLPVPYVGHDLRHSDHHTLDDPAQLGEVDSDQWAIEGSDPRNLRISNQRTAGDSDLRAVSNSDQGFMGDSDQWKVGDSDQHAGGDSDQRVEGDSDQQAVNNSDQHIQGFNAPSELLHHLPLSRDDFHPCQHGSEDLPALVW